MSGPGFVVELAGRMWKRSQVTSRFRKAEGDGRDSLRSDRVFLRREGAGKVDTPEVLSYNSPRLVMEGGTIDFRS